MLEKDRRQVIPPFRSPLMYVTLSHTDHPFCKLKLQFFQSFFTEQLFWRPAKAN